MYLYSRLWSHEYVSSVLHVASLTTYICLVAIFHNSQYFNQDKHCQIIYLMSVNPDRACCDAPVYGGGARIESKRKKGSGRK